MVTKKQLKYIRQLGQKKYRDINHEYVIEGNKIVNLAFKLGLDVKYCLCLAGSEGSIDFSGVDRESLLSIISERDMASITQFRTASNVLAVVAMDEPVSLDSLMEKTPQKFIYLDSVRDPGNVGTIIRLADWYGWDAVVLSPDTVEYHNPKVVQASMGSIFRYRRAIASHNELASLHKDIYTIASDMDGETIAASSIPTDKSMCLIVGNESRGVSREMLDLADRVASIKGAPSKIAESLNVAMATAIFLDRLTVLKGS